jgi:glycosyltransferase involved in cell wall biosynthesis
VLYGLQFRFMRRADAVICNSRAAADEIGDSGAKALHVVPNGIDTDKYSPSADARRSWRASRGFSDATPVIAIVARLDPMKDHGNFLQASAKVAAQLPLARFVIAGGGPAEYEATLRQQATQLGIADRILWLGELAETVELYRGIDLLVSASAYGEGFSNAIGEGMACGVATVATDVGDGRVVVGDHGRIVPPRSPEPLAEAMLAMLAADDDAARAARRRWIVERFGVETMVTRTEGILAAVVAQRKED